MSAASNVLKFRKRERVDRTVSHVHIVDTTQCRVPGPDRPLQREAMIAARTRKHPFMIWMHTPNLDVAWRTVATVSEIPGHLKNLSLLMSSIGADPLTMQVHVDGSPALKEFPQKWWEHVI